MTKVVTGGLRVNLVCTIGKQAVTAHCHRDHREEVDPAYCDPRTKPGTGTFSCNTEPCRPR